MKKTLLHRLIYGNKFVLICVAFTLATLFDLILTVSLFGDVGTSYWHLGSRLIICTFAVLSLLVFRYLKSLPFFATIGVHFLVCILMAIFYTWISGFFVELHPRAYFYIIRSIFMIYLPIAAVCVVVERIQKAMTNRKAQKEE